MRQKLEIGQQITLICDGTEKQFTIEKLIGDGATCIAYEASHINTNGITEHYRIKECYPYNADISRNEFDLVWADKSEKQKYFERFKSSYLITNQLKYEETIGNNITNAMLCEGNGTVYSVMEVNHASVYSNVKETSLEKILDTALVLTKVVGNLHKKGYLHLDIKPDNFLVNYEPNTNVWLFDVDSLTSITELKSGIIKSIPYSFNYAAPEQKYNEITKIGYATDVFAIGAVLFERIMHTYVSVDDMSMFADWNLDNNSLFDGINPKSKRLIKNIFKNTLAVSPKRRYQSTDELITALDIALTTIKDKVFIISSPVYSNVNFIGRENELIQIHGALKDHNIVFLHGFGGIGKSEITKRYLQIYENEYDAVVFLKYTGHKEDIFQNITISNFDGSPDERTSLLKKLLNENILVVIDGFDVRRDDSFVNELLSKYKLKLLISSRTDFCDFAGSCIQVEITNLLYENLKELFSYHAKLSYEDICDDTFMSILEKIDYHTYATELLAKLMYNSGYELTELAEVLSNGLISLEDSEDVNTAVGKTTIPAFMLVLFDIFKLSLVQQQVLMDLSMLYNFKIDKSTYRKITNKSTSMNAFNSLIEQGWIKENIEEISDFKYYELHNIIYDLINYKLMPDTSNCQDVTNYILNLIPQNFYSVDPFDKKSEYIIEAVSRFMLNLDIDNKNNVLTIVQMLYKLPQHGGLSRKACDSDGTGTQFYSQVWEAAVQLNVDADIQNELLRRLVCAYATKCDILIMHYFSESEEINTALNALKSTISTYINSSAEDYSDVVEIINRFANRDGEFQRFIIDAEQMKALINKSPNSTYSKEIVYHYGLDDNYIKEDKKLSFSSNKGDFDSDFREAIKNGIFIPMHIIKSANRIQELQKVLSNHSIMNFVKLSALRMVISYYAGELSALPMNIENETVKQTIEELMSVQKMCFSFLDTLNYPNNPDIEKADHELIHGIINPTINDLLSSTYIVNLFVLPKDELVEQLTTCDDIFEQRRLIAKCKEERMCSCLIPLMIHTLENKSVDLNSQNSRSFKDLDINNANDFKIISSYTNEISLIVDFANQAYNESSETSEKNMYKQIYKSYSKILYKVTNKKIFY